MYGHRFDLVFTMEKCSRDELPGYYLTIWCYLARLLVGFEALLAMCLIDFVMMCNITRRAEKTRCSYAKLRGKLVCQHVRSVAQRIIFLDAPLNRRECNLIIHHASS